MDHVDLFQADGVTKRAASLTLSLPFLFTPANVIWRRRPSPIEWRNELECQQQV